MKKLLIILLSSYAFSIHTGNIERIETEHSITYMESYIENEEEIKLIGEKSKLNEKITCFLMINESFFPLEIIKYDLNSKQREYESLEESYLEQQNQAKL